MSLAELFSQACRMVGPLELRAVHRLTGASSSFTVRQPYAFVGRAPQVNVRLEDPSVSQCHAYIQVIGGVPYFTDLGSRTGVIWDDGSRGAGWVPPGRAVQIGPFDLHVEGIESASPPGAPREAIAVEPSPEEALPTAALEVQTDSRRQGTYYPLDRAINLIGRHPTCHLRFMDDSVSYFHCVVVNTPDGPWCVDIFSREGTVLNGRTTRLAQLREGDLIEMGKVSVLVRTGASRERPITPDAATGLQTIEASMPQPKLAEQLGVALAPVREMLEQYQQCLVSLVRVIGTIQQEHATVMCEQLRLTQELTRELRELRTEVRPGLTTPPPHAPAPAAAPPAPPETPAPVPPATRSVPKPQSSAIPPSSDVHNWFLDRMAELGHAMPQPKK